HCTLRPVSCTVAAYVYTSLLVFFNAHRHRRLLHPFPTRRSSDLARPRSPRHETLHQRPQHRRPTAHKSSHRHFWQASIARVTGRSEEHTSELQSRVDLVCRLLLEKKNTRGL